MEKVIDQEKRNEEYFLKLSNSLINSSLKETLLNKLHRDLALRFTTEAEKIKYLHKLKKDLLLHIDQETRIEVYQLIDIEEKENRFELNKIQFLDFYRHWLKLDVDFEKEVENIIKDHKGEFTKLAEKLSEFYARHNAFSPEQLTRLSYWMYCINRELGEIKTPEKNRLKTSYDSRYLNVFVPWGFELFKFIDARFAGVDAEETRYSIIFHFLERNGIIKSDRLKTAYREMVKNETDIKIAFARLSTTIKPGTDIYNSNERELAYILKDFNKSNLNPFI